MWNFTPLMLMQSDAPPVLNGQRCQKRCLQGLISTSLFQFFKTKPALVIKQIPSVNVPCPGLTCNSDCKIDQYLCRVSGSGGGAPLHAKIALELWPSESIPWRDMNPKQQHMVLHCEELSFKWRNNDGKSPWLKFAQGVVDGTFNKGKSLNNMKYASGFNEFCNVLGSTSTHAYKTFCKHFGGPGICKNIAAAKEILLKYEYNGPLVLSWDDTNLEFALSVYEESKSVFLVLGGTDGPIQVTSHDEVEAVLSDATVRLTEKLCLWILNIPLPKIPPIMVATVACGPKDSAEALSQMHFELDALLHDHGIHPISLSSDGTKTKCQMQDIICQLASDHLVQDSKHAAKTSQNQLLTGAWNIVISNFFICYSQLCELTANPLSPLYLWDAENLDRQDDQAAARLLSAQTLEFNMTSYPKHCTLSIYLFILGEFIDAWQNQNIPHLQHVKMVMRARFFLMAWQTHVDKHPNYTVHIQFISHPLVLDHPLPTIQSILYVLGSILLNHTKKDFNYANTLYMQPKVQILTMGAFQELTAEEQSNQITAGYHQTYFNADNLNLQSLMVYPTDAELATASDHAFKEAKQLLATLGIDTKAMLAQYVELTPLVAKQKKASSTSQLPFSFKLANEEDQFKTLELKIAVEDVESIMSCAELTCLNQAISAPLALVTNVPTTEKLNATMGVDHRVRHTGSFTANALQSGNTWNQNKTTLCTAYALKIITLQCDVLSPLQHVHKNMDILSLHMEEIIIGEVITMYAQGNYKGAKNEWLPSMDSIGVPSYINITYQDLTTANGHPLILINLCSFLLGMFQTLSAQSGIIKTLVNNLIKQLKSSKNAARENVVPDHVLGPEAEESSELDEESVEKQNQ
ncbi:hypothetical protein L208DRAFT_1383096 [Tricholoma matsutake]|nr:hypothetical protein L208DRAFT_1383096 [Tricholoma matsutake 945]